MEMANVTIVEMVNISHLLQTNRTQANSQLYPRRETYKIVVPIMIAICLFACVANIYILMSARFIRSTISSNLRLSLSLACIDAWTAFLIGSGLVLNSFLPKVFGIMMRDLNCLRVVVEVLRLSAIFTSIFHLLCLALNQLAGTRFPLRHKTLVTKRVTNGLIFLIWLLPALLCNCYFATIPGQGYQSAVCWSNFALQYEFRLKVFLSVCIPFVSVAIVYVYLVVYILHQERIQKSLGKSESRIELRRRLRAIITTILIVGSFAIGWIPTSTLYILLCPFCLVRPDKTTRELLANFAVAANVLMITKQAINPFIYGFRIPEIRCGLWLMHRTLCGLRAVEENWQDAVPKKYRPLFNSAVMSPSLVRVRHSLTEEFVRRRMSRPMRKNKSTIESPSIEAIALEQRKSMPLLPSRSRRRQRRRHDDSYSEFCGTSFLEHSTCPTLISNERHKSTLV